VTTGFAPAVNRTIGNGGSWEFLVSALAGEDGTFPDVVVTSGGGYEVYVDPWYYDAGTGAYAGILGPSATDIVAVSFSGDTRSLYASANFVWGDTGAWVQEDFPVRTLTGSWTAGAGTCTYEFSGPELT
jgi:hypothetical protein